ncbi:hypothetical protein HID58_067018 [Brassica napus]|uniref:Uncharacterized protein n=1 Tax=Brassica napus TaxID=3708 RepID=A0ABQ7ZHI7_BRANA|nr:hypothetical protein HID58_067018 [Brassica napus]
MRFSRAVGFLSFWRI